MKHQTYQTLHQAHLGNVDKNALLQARQAEDDPFYHNLIDLVLEKNAITVPWDISPFTNKFRSGLPRVRLDETVFAFILRIATIIKEEKYLRSFQKPESQDAILAWESILRNILLCSFALLYNVKWTVQSVFKYLDPAVVQLLSGGHASVLRELLKNVGVTVAQEELYPAERDFQKLNFLHVGQYSSFYWRFLHWMAEAFKVREKMPFYKNLWVEIIIGPLYRTLRCGICMVHFREMVEELKPQLLNTETDFSKLWFDMHNRVHAQRRKQYTFLNEPDYTQSEYEEDRQFMIKALLP